MCLQETKCPEGQFPSGRLCQATAITTSPHCAQPGYHGVAVLSRLPIEDQSVKPFCNKDDCRHISVTLEDKARSPSTIHNLYVPAGGDEPDPKINEKFAHKLQFIDELDQWFGEDCVPARP
jgi:exodeoxyribonuclease III